VQGLIGGSLLQWAIDREGKAADRLRRIWIPSSSPATVHRASDGVISKDR